MLQWCADISTYNSGAGKLPHVIVDLVVDPIIK